MLPLRRAGFGTQQPPSSNGRSSSTPRFVSRSWRSASPTPTRAVPDWRAIRDHRPALIDAAPSSRLIVPDDEIWLDAGVIAGTRARTQRFQKCQRKEMPERHADFPVGGEGGIARLGRHRDEFDLIQRLAREGSFVCS